MKQPLFAQSANPLFRLVILALIALALLYFDHQSKAVETARYSLTSLVHPIQWLVDTPSRVSLFLSQAFSSHTRLTRENQKLRDTNRILQAQLLQLASLKHENKNLRSLLNSSARIPNQFTTARLLAVNMDPFRQRVIINKGVRDGTEDGMPVLDEHGLMGHILKAYPYHSEVMLISDIYHATPVRVLRNGIRSIAAGLGRTDYLNLLYLPVNTDIIEGDLLVTSGLGGKFPPDFPVARVSKVLRPDSSPFAQVSAEPLAGLSYSREVLLITTHLPDTDSDPLSMSQK